MTALLRSRGWHALHQGAAHVVTPNSQAAPLRRETGAGFVGPGQRAREKKSCKQKNSNDDDKKKNSYNNKIQYQ